MEDMGETYCMTLVPKTRESLLIRVRDPGNGAAWNEFARIYRPMIYRIARQKGLQDCDADDLAQRVLLSVSQAIGNWERDRSRGTFRGWLTRVTRNAIINWVTRGPRELSVGGSDFLLVCDSVQDGNQDLEQLIEAEHHRSVLRVAADKVRTSVTESTWQAFWMTTIDGADASQVAQELGMTTGAVYGARARVMRQLHLISGADDGRIVL